jgi:hypothetical protein
MNQIRPTMSRRDARFFSGLLEGEGVHRADRFQSVASWPFRLTKVTP